MCPTIPRGLSPSKFHSGRFQVNDLISNNQLNICSEEKVFTAVLNWLKHDLTERKQYIFEVTLIGSA